MLTNEDPIEEPVIPEWQASPENEVSNPSDNQNEAENLIP